MSRFGKRAAAVAAAAIAGGALSFAGTALAANTTYYVDAVDGSDANVGTSQATAWKTLAKVNATTFSAGDRILLHTDQTWTGRLHPKGSGIAGNPITIGNYGGGAKPVIDGRTLASGGAVFLSNQSHWVISGLEVTSDSGVDNVGATTPGTNRSGILVENTSGQGRSGITIRDNDVHDVNGCFICQGADAHSNGGIAVVADLLAPLGIGSSSWNGVQILDNRVDDVGRTGIVVFDWSAGVLYSLAPDALSQNVRIAGNEVTDIDSDGIMVTGSKNNVVEHNVVDNAGLVTVPGSTEPSSGGIWAAKTINTTFQFNEVSRLHTQTTDGQAFDVDLLAYDTTIQHNYSHDNEGGFLLLMGTWFAGADVTVRYNLSVNDAHPGKKGVFTFSYGLPSDTDIYNNTIYVAPGLPTKPFYMDGWSGTTTIPWSFRNNVVVNHGSGGYVTPTGPNAKIDHNLFFGNHPASEPADPDKITADPQLLAPLDVAPSGLASVTGYRPAPGSPAAGSGVLIGGNGGRDFFGSPVSATAPPTRGFAEVASE